MSINRAAECQTDGVTVWKYRRPCMPRAEVRSVPCALYFHRRSESEAKPTPLHRAKGVTSPTTNNVLTVQKKEKETRERERERFCYLRMSEVLISSIIIPDKLSSAKSLRKRAVKKKRDELDLTVWIVAHLIYSSYDKL